MATDLIEHLRATVATADRLSDRGSVAVNVGLLRYTLAELEHLTAELARTDEELANAVGQLVETEAFGDCP